MSISTTLFDEISHASLFFTGQLRNPWQMLAEAWGSVEPRLKNTGLVMCYDIIQHVTAVSSIVTFSVTFGPLTSSVASNMTRHTMAIAMAKTLNIFLPVVYAQSCLNNKQIK